MFVKHLRTILKLVINKVKVNIQVTGGGEQAMLTAYSQCWLKSHYFLPI